MKKLLIAAALVASFAAQADTLFYVNNQVGGRINLTDNSSAGCKKIGKDYLVAYSVSSDENEEPLRGCWRIIDDSFHVLWDTGSERMFSISKFRKTDYWINNYEKKAERNAKAQAQSL